VEDESEKNLTGTGLPDKFDKEILLEKNPK